MTMLNKKMLIEALKEKRYEDACYDGEKPLPLDSYNDVHDDCIFIVIGDITIEEHELMYGEMLSIINNSWKEIADEVNDYIDEECQTYYGDPAFSSARDYYSYRFG